MRRIQIYMDEELDSALEAESRRTGRSKAALIRQCVAQQFRPLPRPEDDPLAAFLGASDDDPVDDIDAVVYGG
ncbi:MAG: ribbon-helix-helix domain-containing protein [Pseudonocardia sp.]|nr:ribbon-helix-helix domain-containing protein [Pseudonocardia sp.]